MHLHGYMYECYGPYQSAYLRTDENEKRLKYCYDVIFSAFEVNQQKVTAQLSYLVQREIFPGPF